jgi:anti-sigma regulatory factor (Ser/Thr protein kinase)
MTDQINLSMPAAPHSAAEARRALDELEDRVDPPVLEDLRLLVTELVTNSVRHADTEGEGRVEMSVRLDPELVRVEVRDEGRGFEPVAEGAGGEPGTERRSLDGELRHGGWGLYLVERVATRWGVRREGGTRVWFELERAPQPCVA